MYCSLYQWWLLISLLLHEGKFFDLLSHGFHILHHWLAFCFWKANLHDWEKITSQMHYMCLSAPWNTLGKGTLSRLLVDFLLRKVYWRIEKDLLGMSTKGQHTITRSVPTNPAKCFVSWPFIVGDCKQRSKYGLKKKTKLKDLGEWIAQGRFHGKQFIFTHFTDHNAIMAPCRFPTGTCPPNTCFHCFMQKPESSCDAYRTTCKHKTVSS